MSNSGHERGFTLCRLRDIIAKPPTPVEWVVERLCIRAGVAILSAKPKVGKTTWVQALMVCVARGEPFLDLPTIKGKVIFLALEGHLNVLTEDFRKLGVEPDDEDVLIHVGSAPQNAVAKLAELIELHKPVLVVIDTLVKFLRIQEVNSYGEVNSRFEPLLDLARKSGTHILCLHHDGKGKKSAEDSLLGSTAFLGMVDILISLRCEGKKRVISTTVRFGEPLEKSYLEMDPSTKRIFLAGSKEEAEINFQIRAIEMALRSGPMSEAQIQELVAGRTQVVKKSLRQAFAAGQVSRTGEGIKGDPYIYSLPIPIVVPAFQVGAGNQNSDNTGSETPHRGPECDSESAAGGSHGA